LIPGRGTKIPHAVLHSRKKKRARMICFSYEDRATVEALTSSCQVPSQGTECGVLKFVLVLSKGLTLHFEMTQIIYSENDLNWRIKKSEISIHKPNWNCIVSEGNKRPSSVVKAWNRAHAVLFEWRLCF